MFFRRSSLRQKPLRRSTASNLPPHCSLQLFRCTPRSSCPKPSRASAVHRQAKNPCPLPSDFRSSDLSCPSETLSRRSTEVPVCRRRSSPTVPCLYRRLQAETPTTLLLAIRPLSTQSVQSASVCPACGSCWHRRGRQSTSCPVHRQSVCRGPSTTSCRRPYMYVL